MFKRMAILMGLIALPITTAQADEVWQSDVAGEIIYHDEIGGIAVFTFDRNQRGPRAYMYIEDLAGNYYNRTGSFHGYWIDPTDSGCTAELVGPDGTRSTNWGRIEVRFDRPEFPTGFSAWVGDCFERPNYEIRAE